MSSYFVRHLLVVVRLGSLNLSAVFAVNGLEASKDRAFYEKDREAELGTVQIYNSLEANGIEKFLHFYSMDDSSPAWFGFCERVLHLWQNDNIGQLYPLDIHKQKQFHANQVNRNTPVSITC